MKCFCAILESIPARVSWIEISPGRKLPDTVPSIPARVSWIEISPFQLFLSQFVSIPARVSWIEISFFWILPVIRNSRYLRGYRGLKSHIVLKFKCELYCRYLRGYRGLKFYLLAVNRLANNRRYLRGYRGLKFLWAFHQLLTSPSIPTRVSWIEIWSMIVNSRLKPSRYLRGYRGLKYPYSVKYHILLGVDTCEGIVDWNLSAPVLST